MDRRTFIQLAAAPALSAASDLPSYRIQSRYPPGPRPGIPGPYRGTVARVHSEAVINEENNQVNSAIASRMLSEGMRALTKTNSEKDAWAKFFSPDDIIGIKVNCSGAPNIMSAPEVVARVVENLIGIGIKPAQIYIYERYLDQLTSVHYERYVPDGVQVVAVENPRRSLKEYDPETYVEVNFFGEQNTRSNLVRLVSEHFTKIIEIPNMKDHGAAGVTGALKNVAYGNFSNVARSHSREKTHTLSFIGTLASVEPLRSKTVLHIMDGLRGVWHGGPFLRDNRFRFYPKTIMFSTDPVAMDRLLLDVIENKRKNEGALSMWDRSRENLRLQTDGDIRSNRFVREPGHIEFAAKLGLGEYEKKRIHVPSIEV